MDCSHSKAFDVSSCYKEEEMLRVAITFKMTLESDVQVNSHFKLSAPPTYIYLYTIGCTIEPPSFCIFKSVCLYGKFVFILVFSLRSVRQK